MGNTPRIGKRWGETPSPQRTSPVSLGRNLSAIRIASVSTYKSKKISGSSCAFGTPHALSHSQTVTYRDGYGGGDQGGDGGEVCSRVPWNIASSSARQPAGLSDERRLWGDERSFCSRVRREAVFTPRPNLSPSQGRARPGRTIFAVVTRYGEADDNRNVTSAEKCRSSVA